MYTYGNSLIRKDSEYPLFDGGGHERTVTNGSQTVTGTINFDGFGNTVGSSGSSSDPYMYGATSGYRTEGDAGLSQVGARYYDSQVGRFITRDTELDEHPYLYCDHDPINATDPSGHDKVTVVIDGHTYTVIGSPGTTVTVPGPSGPITITIPPATSKPKKKPKLSGTVTAGQDPTGKTTGTVTIQFGNVTGGLTGTQDKKPAFNLGYKF